MSAVLIADDKLSVRKYPIKKVLLFDPHINVYETSSAIEALNIAHTCKTDSFLSDISPDYIKGHTAKSSSGHGSSLYKLSVSPKHRNAEIFADYDIDSEIIPYLFVFY